MPASLQGKLLVASPALVDPNFLKSVVLMVQHDENNALGVILNRPLEITVAQACEQVLEQEYDVDGVIHLGGPCEGPLMVVHDQEDAADLTVMDGVYFTTEREKIERLLVTEGAELKFFVGYSGWGAGQLEAEMETGSWLVAPADGKLVFGADDQWGKLKNWIGLGGIVDPKLIPDDPSLN